VVTAIDGYQMARKGRAGAALAAAGLGSFFAGCVGTIIIAAFAPPLTELAFKFGPAEYFSLMVLGLIGAVVLASGSLVKAICDDPAGPAAGPDQHRRDLRRAALQLRHPELTDGIGFVTIAMGVFGFGEIIANLGRPAEHREVFTKDVKGLWPTKQDFTDAFPAVLRGTALGSILGVLPGGGALLASFAAYTVEKKTAAAPAKCLSARATSAAWRVPKSANNAGAQTSFIPMLTLGIPPNAVMALMVGAMTIKGIQPGPQVMTSNPELFWGLIASMWVGNLMLIILNLPLIGIWIKLLTVPYRFLYPAILVLLLHRPVHAEQQQLRRLHGQRLFGLVGYIFYKLGCEPAPLLLGFILGPMMEENLRRACCCRRGDWTTFITRPLSGTGCCWRAVLMIVVVMLPAIRNKREEAFQDAD
jgi:putative tricarboxylic transport membrane protein